MRKAELMRYFDVPRSDPDDMLELQAGQRIPLGTTVGLQETPVNPVIL